MQINRMPPPNNNIIVILIGSSFIVSLLATSSALFLTMYSLLNKLFFVSLTLLFSFCFVKENLAKLPYLFVLSFLFSISSSISLLNNSIDALSNSVSLCSFYFFLVAFFKSIHFKLNLPIITKITVSRALIGSATNSKRIERNDNLATMLHCLIIYFFSSHFLCHTNRLLTNPIMAITNNTTKITFPVSLPLIKSFRKLSIY